MAANTQDDQQHYDFNIIEEKTINASFQNHNFTQLQYLKKAQTNTPEPIIIS
jgi:hypothetical protein